VFASLAWFFPGLAATQPALLIVEDLHWSDETSLEFLGHLARRCATHQLPLVLAHALYAPRAAIEQFMRALKGSHPVGEAPLAVLYHRRDQACETLGEFERARNDRGCGFVAADIEAGAGAELREYFTVEDLVWDGDHVSGITGQPATGATATEQPRIVIGADGVHSLIARRVDARIYNSKPTCACAYYSYWSGAPADGVEFYPREHRGFGVLPTHDGLTRSSSAGRTTSSTRTMLLSQETS
jgi:hypothetical protein